MKSRFLLCLLLVFCGSVSAGDKAIGLQGTGLSTTSEGGQKWALVVGINQYSNVPALNYATADAKALYESLLKAGFPADNIMLMIDTATSHLNPTRGNLRARIDQLATLVGKDDVLLFFFSGHGTEKNGAGYLVPIDGSTTDIGSLIPLSWVKLTLETSAAKHRLLILDACHSGAKAGDASASPADVMLSDLSGAAFATLSSCDTDQLSYEDKDSGHGVFTSAIIEGLTGAADRQAQGNNDNIVDATELWAYASLKTKQWGLRSGKVQTPVLKADFKGLIEITRFQSVEELKEQKDKLRKKLEMMEDLDRNSAAEELRKEIAKLETQLNTIGGGVGDITGSDEVQLAYVRYEAVKKQVDDLNALLAEQSKIYQPTSGAIAKIKKRITTAKSELQTALDAKYQADAIMHEVLQTQIETKQANYDELAKDLLPTAPQVKKLAAEIEQLKSKRLGYETGYMKIRIPELLSKAYANNNKQNCKIALSALQELLAFEPSNSEAVALQNRIFSNYDITNYIGMKLVYIPAGKNISQGFYMGQTEVTQAEYRAVMGTNPSECKGDSNPVDRVHWNDAMEFCRKLSQKEGETYTLPTEAQWEYACRAGSTTRFSFGDSKSDLYRYGNYCDSSSTSEVFWKDKEHNDGYDKSSPVRSFKANDFGLYDMHGNVAEWCVDCYEKGSSYRVLRGGSWNYSARDCRSADRKASLPDGRNYKNIGFRVVLSVSSLDFR